MVERLPVTDARWRHRVAALERRWRRRLWRRRLFGWLPTHNRIPRILRGRRTREYVRQSYDETWASRDWPDTVSPPVRKKLQPGEWHGEGMLIRHGGIPRVHFLYMAEVIEALRPRSILEVGCGNGNTLFVLSTRFPGLEWTGVELAEASVDRAHRVQDSAGIPEGLVAYCPWKVADDTAYRRIDFRQGDATDLPFEDNSFDRVVTRQALEQMDMVRQAAISEVTRVAKKHVMLMEPLVDFNAGRLRHDYSRAKDLISYSVADLERRGIEVMGVIDGFPQGITLGVGLVVGRVRG